MCVSYKSQTALLRQNLIPSITYSVPSDLAGPGLTEQHCTVEHVDGVVMLHPKHGECFINYEEVARPTKLNQGETTSKNPPSLVYLCFTYIVG